MKAKRTAKGFEFLFRPEQLQTLLNENPDKILISTSLESEVLKSGEKVGVLRVTATSIVNNRKGLTMSGCPVPPCSNNLDPEEEFPHDMIGAPKELVELGIEVM
jgi:hypothetical protein